MPGDELLPHPDAVMDRGFTVSGTPEQVWPWIVQLGKGRAGWYLPRRIERLLPRDNRAIRVVDPQWQNLGPGDIVADYGRNETLEVVSIEASHTLVYTSQRRRMTLTWVIVLSPASTDTTRVHLRLRLGPIRRKRLVATVGELFDWLTIAAMAAGLSERLRPR